MFTHKCIQADLSRGRIPAPATLGKRLRFLRPYGVNALLVYLESVVPTRTFPSVGGGASAVTLEYLGELRRLCRENGCALMPIIQVFGHQQNLLRLDEFEHLGELPPPLNREARTNNFRPDSPEVRRQVQAWLDELLPCFDGPFVHIGCDEVCMLGRGRTKEAIAQRGVVAVVAEYVAFIDRIVQSHGRTTVMWADFVVRYPELRDRLPPSVVLANWGYGTPGEVYEEENGHFRAHAMLAGGDRRPWVCGNNGAEYVFTPMQRLEENTRTWIDLAGRHGASVFLITEWGHFNASALSVLGDLYVLMLLENPRLDRGAFLEELARRVAGCRQAEFMQAVEMMGLAQGNAAYFDPRNRRFGPIFPSLLLSDPRAGGSLARRLGAIEREGLDRFLQDARAAADVFARIDCTRAAEPDYAADLVALSKRVLMMALRVRLWHEYAWDTGYLYPRPERSARLRAWKDEYAALARHDLESFTARWRAECLPSGFEDGRRALAAAQSAIDAMPVGME